MWCGVWCCQQQTIDVAATGNGEDVGFIEQHLGESETIFHIKDQNRRHVSTIKGPACAACTGGCGTVEFQV